MSGIKNSICDLESKVSDVLAMLSSGRCPARDPSTFLSSQPATTQPRPRTSYADIASKAVTSAVNDSLKAKINDERIDVSVMVFGLPESKKDSDNFSWLLQDDIQSIARVYRIGNPRKVPPISADKTPNVAPPRPLRIEVRNKNYKNWVLRNAKFLARTYNQPGVRIAKCLTSVKMNAVKDLRIECSNLNKSRANLSNSKETCYHRRPNYKEAGQRQAVALPSCFFIRRFIGIKRIKCCSSISSPK